jgi:hypothetical protein
MRIHYIYLALAILICGTLTLAIATKGVKPQVNFYPAIDAQR